MSKTKEVLNTNVNTNCERACANCANLIHKTYCPEFKCFSPELIKWKPKNK